MISFIKNIKFNNILFLTLLGLIIFYGIYYHINVFILSTHNSFCNDECCILLNAELPFFDLFKKLPSEQITPPLFSIITKVIINKFGFDDIILRIIPFSANLLSILLFPFLSYKFLKNKFGILSANLFFVLNQPIIFYSIFFKHYSFDILITIIILIVAVFIKNKVISNKPAFCLGILSCISILFSYTSFLIIICLFFAKFLYDKYVNKITDFKPFLIFILTISVFSLIMAFLSIIPIIQDEYLKSFWFFDNFYVQTLTINNMGIKFIEQCINYFLINNVFILIKFPVFLYFLILSLYIYYKEEKFKYFFFISIIILIIFLSLLYIYPFGPSRATLYFIPIFILLIFKSFDIIFLKKPFLYCITIMLFLYNTYTCIYPNYKKLFIEKSEYEWSYTKYHHNLLYFSDITSNDYIYGNWAAFMYYNKKQNIKLNDDSDIHFLDNINQLNKIKKNNIIFFCPYDNYNYETTEIQNWIKENCKIIYEITNNDLYLVKIIKCKKLQTRINYTLKS